MELGKSIRAYREHLSMSQEQLAEKVYVSRQTISSWENDKSYPDIHSLVLMAEIFHTTVDKMVKGDYETIKMISSHADQKELRKWGTLLTVLFILLIVLAVPLIYWLDWLGIMCWILICILAMVVAFKVEKLKKKYDIRTYREIVSFMEGSRLDEIEKAKEDGKFWYQKGLIVVGFVLIAIIITYGMMSLFR